MWIVRLALRNPYSVAVLALFLLIMGGLSMATMLTDIFPVVDIPVVSVIWSYPGLTAEQMESDVVIISERAFSTTVQGISTSNRNRCPVSASYESTSSQALISAPPWPKPQRSPRPFSGFFHRASLRPTSCPL